MMKRVTDDAREDEMEENLNQVKQNVGPNTELSCGLRLIDTFDLCGPGYD